MSISQFSDIWRLLVYGDMASGGSSGCRAPVGEERRELLDDEPVIFHLGQAGHGDRADDAYPAHDDGERSAVRGVPGGVEPCTVFEGR